MANKYIRHGETYCGDGTTSAAATSDGGVGAWNNINVFEGTAPPLPGALVAGDIVYIRSKNAAGADIEVVFSAEIKLGSSAGIATANVSWILDGGVVWPGIAGKLTYTCTSISMKHCILLEHNRYIGYDHDTLIVQWTGTSTYENMVLSASETDFLTVRWPNRTGTGGLWGVEANGGLHKNLKIHAARGSTEQPFFLLTNTLGSSRGAATLINPQFEVLNALVNSYLFGFSGGTSGYVSQLTIIGGEVYGAGATTGLYVHDGRVQMVAHGFKFPSTLRPMHAGANQSNCFVAISGADGKNGSCISKAWGEADSREDGYYPYLNARLPDAASSGWSWKMYPVNTSSVFPGELVMQKFYVSAASVRGITLHLLIPSTFSPSVSNAWIEVSYISDSTGKVASESTRYVAGSLVNSDASWSSSSYGAIGLGDPGEVLKIELTTAEAIKQDTMVTVAFYTLLKSASSDDILFICPDFTVL